MRRGPVRPLGSSVAIGPGRNAAPVVILKGQDRKQKSPAASASQPSIAFAIDVSRVLRTALKELSKQAGTMAFCSALGAELASIQEFLETLDPSVVEPSLDRRAQKLLDNLERLCRWPSSFNSPASSSGLDPARYTALGRAVTDHRSAIRAIKTFAADPRTSDKRKQLIKLLKAFKKPEKAAQGPDLAELVVPGASEEASEDHQKYIKSLYSSLASHCLCLNEGHQKEITTHLRLRSHASSETASDGVEFKVFFLDHPHDHSGDGLCHWQETQISVLRKRAVMFKKDPPSSASPAGTPGQGQLISADDFCRLITNRQRAQLKLAVSDAGLFWEGSAPLTQAFHLQASTVPLAKLLSTAKLSRKMKLLLSYFLAKAVWQFYDSEWMRRGWTKEEIHFMFERRSKTPKGIFINEPFLAAHFDGAVHPGGEESKDKDGFRFHLFPKILSLGILFLEIELGIRIEDYILPEFLGPDGQPTVNTRHLAAMEVFGQTELWEERETFAAFKDVIEACLVPEGFKPFLNDTEALRSAIEKTIINPLQVLYKSAWEMPDSSNIRAIEIDGPGSNTNSHRPSFSISRPISPVPRSPSPSNVGQPSPGYSQISPPGWPYLQAFLQPDIRQFVPSVSPSPSLPDGVMSSSNAAFSSDTWFERLDRFNSVLRAKPKEKDGSYKRVKVAVLDTGVQEDFVDFVEEYKDFVDGQDDVWKDHTGHGTNAVRLIQKMYNMAEIYVGRVFEQARAADNTPALVAQAILHAKDVWGVDVIVLASGFDAPYRDIIKAIEEANRAHILIFAAASNYGNLAEVAFPGRLYTSHKVMCMFSTDASARSSPNFNPSALAAARYSFAVLGESITLPHVDRPLSGTSFATMIGAGLAARILDFARHKDTRCLIRGADALGTVEGMSAVFSKMVRGAVDNGYHCLAPWKLLPREVEGEEDVTVRRSRERGYVCETISRALEDMYGV